MARRKIFEGLEDPITSNKKEIIKNLQASILGTDYAEYKYIELKGLFDKKLTEIVKDCESDEKNLTLDEIISLKTIKEFSLRKIEDIGWTLDCIKKYLADKDLESLSESEQVTGHLGMIYDYHSILLSWREDSLDDLPNKHFQNISDEAILPSLTKWIEKNDNLNADEVAEIAGIFWRSIGVERREIAKTVNAVQKEIYGTIRAKGHPLRDPMSYFSNWKSWIEYIENKIKQENSKAESKFITKNTNYNASIKDTLIRSFGKKEFINEKLLGATDYGIFHHEDDCTDGDLKQENAASYYYAYHEDDQHNIIFDAMSCVHKEPSINSENKMLLDLLKVENIEDLYKWYYYANHETLYNRGSSSIYNWLANAKAKTLGYEFNKTKDRNESSLKLPFKGQFDQFALSCFDVDEFMSGLKLLNPDIFDHVVSVGHDGLLS